MNKFLYLFFITSLFALENFNQINVIEQNEEYVIIEYIINDFSLKNVQHKDDVFQDIILKDEPNFLIKNHPKLPHVNRSFIVPDKSSSIEISVIRLDEEIYENINVIPSKGNPKRNRNIDTIPLLKGDIYNENNFFPGNLYETHDPYILRDFRAQVVQLNPFQYNPVTKILKVYTNVRLKINFTGNNKINELNNLRNSNIFVKDYFNIYSNRFLNFNTYQSRYSPISEDGEMLIICYDSFCNEMAPFVNWKNQKGIKTTLVTKSEAGNSASTIKNYVQSFYNTHDLTYLLFVGDKSQIPTFTIGSGYSSGESDVSYAYLSGNDSYPEFFVGRFSAQNTGHVSTEVERTIEYERDPQLGASWYGKGLMIASNEGAGSGHDGGESDWQHARNMREDLIDYTYTNVDEMYDGSHGGEDNSGSPSDTMVRNALNGGLGIVHYTGHGDTDVWVTSNFNTGDVNALTNNNALPFICTVGCKSGDFGGTCLGEVFTYATNGNDPTGAIATFMSTIYQSWAPPMEAQDEMVDILVESFSNNRKYTFGGISWNGCLEMNDNYGSSGYDETDHWTLFGDPSVAIRTDAPSVLSISHSGAIDPNNAIYEVVIDGNYDNVLVALSYNGEYLGSSYSDNGAAIIELNSDISNYSELTLTATGYNTTTVIDEVSVGSSCPGYIFGDLNGDSLINIQDIVILVNIVLDILSPNDCQEEFGDLNGDGVNNILDVILTVNIILDN